MMAGLDEGTVEFRPTYNGEDEEPEIIPGLFPNLLANGASGIAVGMATNIPSHNVAEIINAALLLVVQPAASLEHIMAMWQGTVFEPGRILTHPPPPIQSTLDTHPGS